MNLLSLWQFLATIGVMVTLTTVYSSEALKRKCGNHPRGRRLEKCLADEIMRTLKFFANGSEVDGLPPMDPVHMTDISFCRGYGPVRANIDFPTSTLAGIGHADKIISVRYMPAKSTIEFSSHHPYVRKRGQYNMTGSFTEVFAVGKGFAHIDMWDVVIHHTLRWRRARGELRLEKYRGSVRPEEMKVFYENLRAQSRQEQAYECMQAPLEDDVNRFFNENWKVLYDALSPSIDSAFSFVFRDYMEALLRRLDLIVSLAHK